MEHRWNHNSSTKLSAGNCPSPNPNAGQGHSPVCPDTSTRWTHDTGDRRIPTPQLENGIVQKRGHLTLVEQNLFSRRLNKSWLIPEKLNGTQALWSKEHFSSLHLVLVGKGQNRKSRGRYTETQWKGGRMWVEAAAPTPEDREIPASSAAVERPPESSKPREELCLQRDLTCYQKNYNHGIVKVGKAL